MKPEPTGYFKVVDLPYPETEEEVYLKLKIDALKKEYQQAIDPLVNRLGQIAAARPGKYALVPCDQSEYGAFKISDAMGYVADLPVLTQMEKGQ